MSRNYGQGPNMLGVCAFFGACVGVFLFAVVRVYGA